MYVTSPSKAEVTIASGASLSGAAEMYDQTLVALELPDAWTAAGITFQVSNDNSTFVNLYWEDAEYTPRATATASDGVSLEPSAFYGWKYVKVRSGTSGTPVNQGAARTVKLYFKPV